MKARLPSDEYWQQLIVGYLWSNQIVAIETSTSQQSISFSARIYLLRCGSRQPGVSRI
jgi:hypothetical protein